MSLSACRIPDHVFNGSYVPYQNCKTVHFLSLLQIANRDIFLCMLEHYVAMYKVVISGGHSMSRDFREDYHLGFSLIKLFLNQHVS